MAKRGEKTRNGGKWTEAEFNSRIISALRKVSQWWYPANKALREARVAKGLYKCAACGEVGEQHIPPKPWNKKRSSNACIDHRNPVIDPVTRCRLENGKMNWTMYIERMFIEEGFDILCYVCHQKKSNEERDMARPGNVIRNNLIIEAYKRGLPLVDISFKYGVSESLIISIIKQYKENNQ